MNDLALVSNSTVETVPQQETERYDRHIPDLITKLQTALGIMDDPSTDLVVIRDHSLNSLAQIMDAAKNSPGEEFFFHKDTLQFFRSRISEMVYPTFGEYGTLFVSSERNSGSSWGDYDRFYTIRRAYWNSKDVVTRSLKIENVGEFQQYSSRNGAHAAAKRIQRLHVVPRND